MAKKNVRYADLLGLWRGRVPGQLIIQLTDRCNARCPQCGMRVTERFARTRLDTDYVKRVLDAGVARGISMVSFTGGEPFLLLNDLAELINYAGQAGYTYIRTGTNGFLFRNHHEANFSRRVHSLAERLAATPLRNLWFSIDSAEQAIHEKMRGFTGVVEGMAKALAIFHEHGIYPSANLGLNRNITGTTALLAPRRDEDWTTEEEERFSFTFRRGLSRFYSLLIELGFTMTSACYPMSVDPDAGSTGLQSVYGATATDSLVRFSAREKVLLYRALSETVPAFRSRIRIVTPLSSLHSMQQQYAGMGGQAYGCRGGIDFFFVDSAEGLTYPCGYRGKESLGPLWDLSEEALRANRDGNCRQCDWECFRDPSELFGPVLLGLRRPRTLLAAHQEDPQALHLWWDDVRYARACDFFDGRQAMRSERLQGFARTGNKPQEVILSSPGEAPGLHVGQNLDTGVPAASVSTKNDGQEAGRS